LGSGLGDRFLKHIERCGVLIHIIDATHEDIKQDYLTIREELESYSPLLKEKSEIICLNKIDSITEEELQTQLHILQDLTGQEIYIMSGYTGSGVDMILKKTLETIKARINGDDE
jgi:GTP-binding protein